jgi:pSer/pThr/pTyr-binding forkhead associated (FHA) protein
MNYNLVEKKKNSETKNHELTEADLPVILGRNKSCDLVFDNHYVSGEHAEINKVEGQIMIRDLGSTNKTYLNNKKIGEDWHPLEHDDSITLGVKVVELVYQVEDGTIHQDGATVSELPDDTPHGQQLDSKDSGTLILNPNSGDVNVKGKVVKLTKREFDILALLMSKRGHYFAHKEIGYAGWKKRIGDAIKGAGKEPPNLADLSAEDKEKGYPTGEEIRQVIAHVRKKIKHGDVKESLLESKQGFGYRIRPEPS